MDSTRKQKVDLYTVQSVTDRNKHYADEAVRHAREYEGDVHRERRLAERLCPWCFYFRRSMMAGQAFTSWRCSACDKEDMHANTAHPYLCNDCSDKLGLCIRCCADLDLKMRRKLTRGRPAAPAAPAPPHDDSDPFTVD